MPHGVDVDRMPPPLPTLPEHLLELLEHLGVQEAYGLVGGAIASLCDALGRSHFRCYQLRHEAGAVFAACEASLATNRPVAVFVTTGPGLMNALTGALAARWEGAKIIVMSGATSSTHQGRWAVQETSIHTLPASGIFTSGRIFDYATILEHPAQLAVVVQRLAHGFARVGGFVAHVSLPIEVQRAKTTRITPPIVARQEPTVTPAFVSQIAERICAGALAIWVGFGARHATAEILELAARTDAKVMCTPRGKGVFPERHPQFLGVTGCGGHDSLERHLRTSPPLHTLVLGSRLGEFSSCWSPVLVPRGALIHVDIDPFVFGAAYPLAPTVGVQADIATFLRALLGQLGHWHKGSQAPHATPRKPPERRREDAVRPSVLMAAIQEHVVDGTEALVMAESGTSFTWTNHELAFDRPGRYRVSGLWGSMGHATSGVVGAALARRGKAIAVVGDGAMLMMNEVSAAVQYEALAVWIVLNDGGMRIVEQGMQALGLEPFHTQLPRTDFAMLAVALGAEGMRVEHESDLDAALAHAMRTSRPCVIDVIIDPNELAPAAKRYSNLAALSAQT